MLLERDALVKPTRFLNLTEKLHNKKNIGLMSDIERQYNDLILKMSSIGTCHDKPLNSDDDLTVC